MARARHTLLVASIAAAAACAAGCDGAARDPGLRAWLRVEDAQFVAGDMPGANGGPAIESLRVAHNALRVGTARERVSGALAREANAAAIGRDGDAGYWIVTAGVPSAEEPELPSLRGVLELARDFPLGAFTLRVRAVDRAGRFGGAATLRLSAIAAPVPGDLVVRLAWDDAADLDLHVVDAEGVELWARNINTWEPPAPGATRDAGAWQAGGLLDVDSNAECASDGRAEESASWREPAPSGRYTVRVATASLCGEAAAHWTVEVRLHGAPIASASGVSVTTDTRAGAGAGDGVLALSFVVP
jgi:hypothetical protein